MSTTLSFSVFRNALHATLEVLFPNPCLCCQQEVRSPLSAFCTTCVMELPVTDHFVRKDNEVYHHLKGRVSIDRAAALLYFSQESAVQDMLHRLKYKKEKEVAAVLGEWAGQHYLQSSWACPDIILPVPVHWKKKKIRTYNQSHLFGTALGTVVGSPCCDDLMVKEKATPSQTGKSRDDRLQNVRNIFRLIHPAAVTGRNVLVVDDVITTGATLEACIRELERWSPSGISVLVMAAARS